jgi:N-acetylneuraminic acid mutarotase
MINLNCRLFLFAIVFVIALNTNAQWNQKADFGGTARRQTASFSIGSKGYILTGDDGTIIKDLWEYDKPTDTWTRKADLPGAARYCAVGFSIGTKGYVATGDTTGNPDTSNSFWEWDQASNTWTRKADFGGGQRFQAVGFSIGTKGYIGTGDGGGYKKDFWEWNQATNTWTQKTDFGGLVRVSAVGFSIGNKGYIGTGLNPGGELKDFWEYDPATDVWTPKADFGGVARQVAIGYGSNTKGYIGTGITGVGTILQQDFWEWDPATNVWAQLADYGGGLRRQAAAFYIGGCGYIGTGKNGANARTKNFWEFGACGGINLPITLSSFTGKYCDNKSTLLQWTTASETNNDYFTLETSHDGYKWRKLDTIKGAGNSSELLKYSSIDLYPFIGINYYRLLQTDFDGKQTYSQVISVNSENTESLHIFPNPVNINTTGDFSLNLLGLDQTSSVLVVLYDIMGKSCFSKIIISDNNGGAHFVINTSEQLATGVYLIVASANDKLLRKKIIINNSDTSY